ncbi:hypothetical protein MY9_4151 [Bacillus sp. JS]|nr:hypothetical protein MY9_4151 [Bacillus sp. JS]
MTSILLVYKKVRATFFKLVDSELFHLFKFVLVIYEFMTANNQTF